jgi:hypothetical protein
LSNTSSIQDDLDEEVSSFVRTSAFHVVAPIFQPQALLQTTLWIAAHIPVRLPGARVGNKDFVLQNSGCDFHLDHERAVTLPCHCLKVLTTLLSRF